jgi:hypothetical protein
VRRSRTHQQPSLWGSGRHCQLALVIADPTPVVIEPEAFRDDPKIETHTSFWRLVRQGVMVAVAAIEPQKFAFVALCLSLHNITDF